MADAYEVRGVTIQPQAGGYYDLTHTSLGDQVVRVQGKEAAEARADEIATAAVPPEGTMEKQPDIASLTALAPAAPTPPTPPTPDPRDAQMAEMQAQMARMMELVASLGAARTVQTDGPDTTGQVPAGIPRRFAGEMDAATRKRLKDAGFGTETIVLEESETIPPTGLFIGHNGNGYVIIPGEKVEVPDFIVGVLNDAVTSAPIVDGSSGKVLGYRDRSKYPYRRY